MSVWGFLFRTSDRAKHQSRQTGSQKQRTSLYPTLVRGREGRGRRMSLSKDGGGAGSLVFSSIEHSRESCVVDQRRKSLEMRPSRSVVKDVVSLVLSFQWAGCCAGDRYGQCLLRKSCTRNCSGTVGIQLLLSQYVLDAGVGDLLAGEKKECQSVVLSVVYPVEPRCPVSDTELRSSRVLSVVYGGSAIRSMKTVRNFLCSV